MGRLRWLLGEMGLGAMLGRIEKEGCEMGVKERRTST
jgi:hypothetical protein